jgi:hypothetical protein
LLSISGHDRSTEPPLAGVAADVSRQNLWRTVFNGEVAKSGGDRGFAMRGLIRLFAAAVVGLVVGCNQPAVMLKAPAAQSSENTIRDWNDVADGIAANMTTLGLSGLPATHPVFIQVQAPDSAFVQQVAARLGSDVVQSGGVLARQPAGATVVNLDVNFVRWGPRDKPPGLLGTVAGISAIPGIVIGASVPMSTWTAANAAAFTAVGLGAFYDAVIALTPTMNAEAVWEATVVTDDRVIMKLQEQVYIRAPDIPLYAKATSVRPVSSWGTESPLRSRVIRYDP